MILLILLIDFLFIGFSTFLGYYIGDTYSKDHQDNKKNKITGVIIGSSCSIGIVLLVSGLWWVQQTNIKSINTNTTTDTLSTDNLPTIKSRIFNPLEINDLENLLPEVLFQK